MDLPISPGTVVVGKQAVAPTSGTPGHFSDGDPSNNQIPTYIPAYWCENITMEILSVQDGCGMTRDGTKNNQMWTGLAATFAPITSPTFLVSASVNGSLAVTGNGTFGSLNSNGALAAVSFSCNTTAAIAGALTVSGAASISTLNLYGALISTAGATYSGVVSASEFDASGDCVIGGAVHSGNVGGSAFVIGTPASGTKAAIIANMSSGYSYSLIQMQVGGSTQFQVGADGGVSSAASIAASATVSGAMGSFGTLATSGAATLGSTVTASGAGSFPSMGVYGAFTCTSTGSFSGTVSAGGFSTSGNASVTGNLTSGTINTGGNIACGGTVSGAGSFTNLSAGGFNLTGNQLVQNSGASDTTTVGIGIVAKGQAAGGSAAVYMDNTGKAQFTNNVIITAPDANTAFTAFYLGSTQVGGIVPSGSNGTAYNTTSDYRVKSDLEPIDGAASLAKIEALRPLSFQIGDAVDRGRGFLAHELQEQFPHAVSGQKDAVDDAGRIVLQQVDYPSLVADLIAAVQALTARVKQLEGQDA